MILLLPGLLLITAACSKETINTVEGTLNIEVTDAPVDDAQVKGVLVTVGGLELDDRPVAGFKTTTFDLLDLRNGKIRTLIDSRITAGTYHKLTLVLDFDTEANGNTPGCYVLDADGRKHPLRSDTNRIGLSMALDITAGQSSVFILDFDLRKCIKRQENDPGDSYDFVPEAELAEGLRIIRGNQSGVIKGNCTDVVTNSDRIVVYAYRKGTYMRDSEVHGSGESQLEFSNAENSSVVDTAGNYMIPFLTPGEYEIHFCSYRETDGGIMNPDGTLLIDAAGAVNPGGVPVGASQSTTVNVTVTGLLPIPAP